MMMTPDEQPNAKDVPPDEKHAILYARMSSVNTIDEAERIFALLSNGGEIFHADARNLFRIPIRQAAP